MSVIVKGFGQKVEISHRCDFFTGQIVEGELMEVGENERYLFDLDSPFILLTEDGERLRINEPWNAEINVIE